MSVALAPELREEVRAAADRAGKSPDDWFADAVHRPEWCQGPRRAHARLRKAVSRVVAHVHCDSAKVAVIRAAGNRVMVVRCCL